MIRSMWRTAESRLVRDLALVCVADGIVGVSYGAIATGSGLPAWLPMMLSLLVFAGAAQFVFIGLVVSGGNPAAVVLTSLLVNARLVALGFAVGDLLGSGWRRVMGSHLIVDETVAFAVTQTDARQRRAAYWLCGVALFVCWNLGVVLGSLGGALLEDPAALGLDAAFPAVLLALLVPMLQSPDVRRVALVSGGIALAAATVLPAGLPVIAALLGVLALYVGGAAKPDGASTREVAP